MKFKNVVDCTAVALLIAIRANGQGQVNFLNGSLSLVQIEVGSVANPSIVNAPSSVYGTRIQLYYSTNTTSPTASSLGNGFSTSGWTAVGNLGTNITSNGRFSTGVATIPNSVGVNIWLEAIGWSGASASAVTTYTTLASALADSTVYVGSSGVWQQLTGNPSATPPGTAVSTAPYLNAIGNILLGDCPEPGSVSLICLGAASVFMFRRKKS